MAPQCKIGLYSIENTETRKKSLYKGEPMRRRKNLVLSCYRVEFDYISEVDWHFMSLSVHIM